jgi:hypothetical protein
LALFGSKKPKTIKTEDGEVVLGWTLDHPLLSELGPEIEGYATTRLGREALTDGSAERRLAAATPR